MPIVFCETRQLAEEWTYRYLAAAHTWASTEAAAIARISPPDTTSEPTQSAPPDPPPRGKLGGRPTVMTPDKLDVARRMLANGKDKALIARTIGVSRATLYNYLDVAVAGADTAPGRS